jgi:hypothetical protein
MRKPSRISPSALAKFEKDREAYYLSYCAEPRPEREPQSKPASVGSAFDAYVKAELMQAVFGEQTHSFGELFETQVEPQNREFALEAGRNVMEGYVASGSYQTLLDLLEDAEEAPQFEFDADTKVGDIAIAGKPDCRFVHRGGAHIILDWKVNGYCAKDKNNTSPSKGYMICRDGAGWPKPTRSHNTSHKLFEPTEFLGITVNKFFMEQVSIDWADQLSMYGWMMGEPVGSEEMVVCIEQVVAKPTGKLGAVGGETPLLRFASHRCRVSQAHQFGLQTRLEAMWEALQSEYIFTDLDRQGNDTKRSELDLRAMSMVSNGTDEGDFFAKCSRPTTFYKGR